MRSANSMPCFVMQSFMSRFLIYLMSCFPNEHFVILFHIHVIYNTSLILGLIFSVCLQNYVSTSIAFELRLAFTGSLLDKLGCNTLMVKTEVCGVEIT